MSPGELVSATAGLAVGYWVITKLVSAYRRKEKPATAHDTQSNRPGASQSRSGGGEKQQGRAGSKESGFAQWYEVLEVSPSATEEEIRRAYRAKISQYHPDKVASMGEEIREVAEKRSREINAAFETAMKIRS